MGILEDRLRPSNEVREIMNNALVKSKNLAAKAARNNRTQQLTHESVKRYGIPSDIVGIQEELFNQGYFDKRLTHDQAVDGVWGKATLDAVNKKMLHDKYEGKEDKSFLARVERAMAKPVVKTLNNMFQYGYDNSKVSEKAEEKINSILNAIGIDASEKAKKAGKLYGTAVKLSRGIRGTDKAGKALKEFADLDLSKPENKERAKELWAIMNEEEPKYGNLVGSMERRQKSVRARIDQNLLHGGLPQKYNSWTKANGYDTKSGERTWGYSDPEMLKAEKDYYRQYIKTHKPTRRTDDGQYIWEIKDGGDPWAAHGGHSIIASNPQGKDARGYDEWDYGHWDFSSNDLPGMKKVRIGMKVD